MSDKAIVRVSASLLPDSIKTTIGGTTIITLNEFGTDNKWGWSQTLVGTSSEDLIKSGSDFIAHYGLGEESAAILSSQDEPQFIFVKHTGTSDGSAATTDVLCINLADSAPTGSATGDILIKPKECWFARMHDTDVDMINAISLSSTLSTGTGNILVETIFIIDDGGGN